MITILPELTKTYFKYLPSIFGHAQSTICFPKICLALNSHQATLGQQHHLLARTENSWTQYPFLSLR